MILRIAVLAAGLALGHGALHEQIEAVTKAIAAAPRNAALYVKRGELHRLHRQWAPAAADFQLALALEPADSDALLGLARLSADRGADADAEAILSQVLQARPRSEVGFALRAAVRLRLANPAGAAADFGAAIRLSAEPPVDYFLGHAAALAEAGPPAAALAAIDTGKTRLGPLVVLDEWAVQFLVQRQRWDEALSRQAGILAAAPRKESALTRRAEILAAANRCSQAADTFRSALDAWLRLPVRMQETKAMQDLRARIDAGLSGTVTRSAQK